MDERDCSVLNGTWPDACCCGCSLFAEPNTEPMADCRVVFDVGFVLAWYDGVY